MEALENSTTARSVLLGADEIGPEGARAGTVSPAPFSHFVTLTAHAHAPPHAHVSRLTDPDLVQLAKHCSRTGASRPCFSYVRHVTAHQPFSSRADPRHTAHTARHDTT
jgi:hypothetical protein